MEVNKKDLQDALKRAVKIIKPSVEEIQNCIKLEQNDGYLYIHSCSKIASLVTKIKTDAKDVFVCCINPKLLNDSLKRLNDDRVMLSLKKNYLIVRTRSVVLKFICCDANKWYEREFDENNESLNVDVELDYLNYLTSKCSHSLIMDEDVNRQHSLYKLDVVDNKIVSCSATDSYRISVRGQLNSGSKNTILISGYLLRDIISSFQTDMLNIRENESCIQISDGITTVISSKPNCKYFNLEQFINYIGEISIEVDREDLINKIYIAKLVNNELKFDFKENQILINSRSQTNECDLAVKAVMSIPYNVTMGFSATYLLDALNSIEDEKIKFHFQKGQSPFKISGKDYIEIVLPRLIR